MPVLTQSILEMGLPEMYYVRQHFDAVEVKDVQGAVDAELQRSDIREMVYAGQRIAPAVGSREIDKLAVIVRQVGDSLKKLGARPFIVPAMGSHGGATAEGQLNVLKRRWLCLSFHQCRFVRLETQMVFQFCWMKMPWMLT